MENEMPTRTLAFPDDRIHFFFALFIAWEIQSLVGAAMESPWE